MAGSSETLDSQTETGAHPETLPNAGRWHLATDPEAKSRPTIIFVHFFGGNGASLIRHAELVNDIGFNAVTFNLSCNAWPVDNWPWDSHMNLGLMNIWAEEIELMLNAVSGRKILFGFSSPSGAIPIAVDRRAAIDIDAMVFDGGPFTNSLGMVLPTLFNTSNHISKGMRAFAILGSRIIFGKNFSTRSESTLRRLQSNLPILSIRSWKDDVVPSAAINHYFSANPRLDVEVVNLPAGQHLEGLKSNPDEYRHRLEQFLKAL